MDSEFAALKRRLQDIEDRARMLAGKAGAEDPMDEADGGAGDADALEAMQGDTGG